MGSYLVIKRILVGVVVGYCEGECIGYDCEVVVYIVKFFCGKVCGGKICGVKCD